MRHGPLGVLSEDAPPAHAARAGGSPSPACCTAGSPTWASSADDPPFAAVAAAPRSSPCRPAGRPARTAPRRPSSASSPGRSAARPAPLASKNMPFVLTTVATLSSGSGEELPLLRQELQQVGDVPPASSCFSKPLGHQRLVGPFKLTRCPSRGSRAASPRRRSPRPRVCVSRREHAERRAGRRVVRTRYSLKFPSTLRDGSRMRDEQFLLRVDGRSR